jgi:hypothetical protein
LVGVLRGEGQDRLEELPDGIHSGLVKARARGIFFYFQAADPAGSKLHFWRYYDLTQRRIIDNRYLIASLIACGSQYRNPAKPCRQVGACNSIRPVFGTSDHL